MAFLLHATISELLIGLSIPHFYKRNTVII